MKGSQLKFNITVILIAIVYAVILILSNVGRVAVPLATVRGSYAAEFAKEHHLKNYDLSDTEKDLLDFRYENFDYNITDEETIRIENYPGQSEILVIPAFINGKMVTEIGKDFFTNHGEMKKLYLPISVMKIEAEPVETVTLCLDKDSLLFSNTSDNKWNVETLYDSDVVNFLNGDIPYDYNVSGDAIELTKYSGDQTFLIVPSYIDGKPVRTISFDLLGSFTAVVVPETVTAITGTVGKLVYGADFAIELCFTLLAFVLAVMFVNIALPKIKKNVEEIILTSPQIILTYIYVVAQVIFSILVCYRKVTGPFLALVISAIWLVAYIVLMMKAMTGRTYEQEVEQHIEERTSKLREIKASVKGLADGIEDKDVRKQVERVIEEIQYSPLGSRNSDIEDQLMDEIVELKILIERKALPDVTNKVMFIQSLMNQMK